MSNLSSAFSKSVPSSTQLHVAPDPNIVTVIQRFEVPPNQQSDFIKQASAKVSQDFKEKPEFIAAVLLKGSDIGQMASYAQWRKTADSPAPATVPTAWSLASALQEFTLLDSRTYAVEFIYPASASTLLSPEKTPLAHFGLFALPRENQDRLLELARENGPRAVEMTSGLLSVNFHRSIDGLQVINLGTWDSFESRKELVQRSGFSSSNQYWADLSDFQAQFFDLVFV